MFNQDRFTADLATIYQFANELFAVDTRKIGTLFHYTTCSGLMGIFSSKTFRATHIKFLNDSKEYQYAREQIANGIESCLQDWRGISLDDGYRRQVKEILYSASSELQQSLRADNQPPEVYVVCFCVAGDRVDQWKGYGAEGFGYSIGFRSAELESVPNCRLITVNYGATDLERIIRRCMEYSAGVIEQNYEKEHIDALKECFVTFLMDFTNEISPGFKHDGFQDENEVRLVINGDGLRESRGFLPRGSIVAPFWKIVLEENFSKYVETVVVGPSAYANVAEAGILSYLSALDLTDVRVQRSNQPYRVLR
jgi:hypothetical protein